MTALEATMLVFVLFLIATVAAAIAAFNPGYEGGYGLGRFNLLALAIALAFAAFTIGAYPGN